jgi:hypothetical protein
MEATSAVDDKVEMDVLPPEATLSSVVSGTIDANFRRLFLGRLLVSLKPRDFRRFLNPLRTRFNFVSLNEISIRDDRDRLIPQVAVVTQRMIRQ